MGAPTQVSEPESVPTSPKWCIICGAEEPYDESGVCWSCIGRAKDATMDSGERNMPVLVIAALLALSGLLAIGQGMAFYSAGGDVLLFGHNVGSSEVWGVWSALLGMLVLASAGSSIKRSSSLTPVAGSVLSILALGFFVGAIIGVVALVLTLVFSDRFG